MASSSQQNPQSANPLAFANQVWVDPNGPTPPPYGIYHPIFNTAVPAWVGNNRVDFRKTGILYEHQYGAGAKVYYIIFQIDLPANPATGQPAQEGLARDWIDPRHVGKYLEDEWNASNSQVPVSGYWTHDTGIQDLRRQARQAAADVRRDHPNYSQRDFIRALTVRLQALVKDHFSAQYLQDRAEQQEAAALAAEFTNA